MARPAGGRSRATASPVTKNVVGGEGGIFRLGHPSQHRVARVDLDAYVCARPTGRVWTSSAGRRRPTGPEADELVERYQQVATHCP